MPALLDDDDLWPGQCPTCGKDESACHCDDDLDADLIPGLSRPARKARLAMLTEASESVATENAVDERGTMCEHGHDADDCWLCYCREQNEDDDREWEG